MNNAEFLKRLGIQYPIIQAPMVGVSTPQLAAVVTNAGALGSIGIGASTPDQAREMMQSMQALTDGPFNVNLFCHQPAQANAEIETAWLAYLRPYFAEFGAEPPSALRETYTSFLESPETQEVLLEARPAVVSFHFGLPPREWIDALSAKGIITLACATTPEEAAAVEAVGVDAVVAQGVEAGGHRGAFDPDHDREIGTFALVSLLAQSCRLPIIAAGGIMNGRGITAALQLGAAAVQMGTAFILCPESAANEHYRRSLQSDLANATQISKVISGRAARGLPNRLFTDAQASDAPAVPDYPRAYDATKALIAAAVKQGSHDFAVQWAGQGAPLARALPAAELIELLVKEMEMTQQ